MNFSLKREMRTSALVDVSSGSVHGPARLGGIGPASSDPADPRYQCLNTPRSFEPCGTRKKPQDAEARVADGGLGTAF